jgi:hypothetical protein
LFALKEEALMLGASFMLGVGRAMVSLENQANLEIGGADAGDSDSRATNGGGTIRSENVGLLCVGVGVDVVD